MLSDYLKRAMEVKGLSAKDIERRSGGNITDSTIGNILAGRNRNLSVEKINALAVGLDVNPVEVFMVASGQPVKREATVSNLAFIIQKLADNSELFKLVESLVRQKPAEIKRIKKILKID